MPVLNVENRGRLHAAALAVPLALLALIGLAPFAGGSPLTWALLGEATLVLVLAVLLRWPAAHADAGRLPARLWPLGAVLVLALALRLIGLDSGLWYDEVVTLTEFVRQPFADLVRCYSDQNQHPLFSVAARASVLVLGESAWALRLPAVLFGVASLGALYGFARRVAGGSGGAEPLLATILMAVSYHHVWFSQNARGYTGLLFGTLLGSSLLLDNLRRPGAWHTVAYAAAMALALYTHLTAAFILGAHGLIVLAVLIRRGYPRPAARAFLPLLGIALAGLLAVQLYAPALPQVIASFERQTGGRRVEAWTSALWGAGELLRGFRFGFAGTAGAVLAAGVVLAGLASYWRSDRVVLALLLLPCVLGAAVMLLLNRHMYPRFFFPVLPFGILVAVRGAFVLGRALSSRFLGRSESNRVGIACAAVLVVLSAASLPACYALPKQDYAGALAYVHAARHPEDPVVAVGMAAIPVGRYYAPETAIATNACELAALRASRPGQTTWLICTFRDHLEAYHPDLVPVIDRDFVQVKVFPGTVGGGAVIVCRAAPVAPDAVCPRDVH